MGDKYFSTGEMWNNICAACYQDVMLGNVNTRRGGCITTATRPASKKIIDLIAQGTLSTVGSALQAVLRDADGRQGRQERLHAL